MERDDFLALLDVVRMQRAYAPPPIDQRKVAAFLVSALSTGEDGRSVGHKAFVVDWLLGSAGNK